jgi:tetratricopeptide (TPR) repeat protein
MKTKQLTVFFFLTFVSLYTFGQAPETFYYPKLIRVDKTTAKTTLAGLIRGTTWGKPEMVSVSDDRIDMTFKGSKRTRFNQSISFSELADYPIRVTRTELTPAKKSNGARITYFSYALNLKNCYLDPKVVYDWFFLKTDQPAPAFTLADSYARQNAAETENNYKQLADYLYFFQYPFMVQKYDSALTQFKTIAAQYRELKTKPAVTEEQRKFIVQANAFNERKDYVKALNYYNKAVDLDKTAYPSAYMNMALLSAQIQNYEGAIFQMKKYLMLVPEAEDARGAQDKIYEWEGIIGK